MTKWPAFLLLLAAACDPQRPGDGKPGATGTPTPTPTPTDTADGTLALVAPYTQIFAPVDQDISRPTVGDFDGDGQADLALDIAGEAWVWFGPLPAGDLQATDAPVHILGGDVGAAADVDGDGDDELAIGGRMVAVPAAGVHDAAALAVADLGDVDEIGGPFADLDGDGHLDVVLPFENALWLVYGPLAAFVPFGFGKSEPATPSTAVMRGPDYACVFADAAWALPDLSGDGLPELYVSAPLVEFTGGAAHCGEQLPNLLLAGGDWRGRNLDLTAATHRGLLADLEPVGDTDGDGLPELGSEYGLWHATDLWSSGAAAVPFAWVERGVGGIGGAKLLDLSGDGRDELVFGWGGGAWAADGALAVGDLTGAIGRPVDPALTDFQERADLTGDGVPDGVASQLDRVSVHSGAELTKRWAEAP